MRSPLLVIVTTVVTAFTVSGCPPAAPTLKVAATESLAKTTGNTITPMPAPEHAVVLPMRVYVTPRVKRDVHAWRSLLDAQISDVNLILAAAGGRVHVEEIREWDTEVEDLDEGLAALIEHDPADDGVFVVALVAAGPKVTNDQRALGRTEVLTRHAVLRFINHTNGLDSLMRNLRDLNDSEFRGVAQGRLRHKRAIIMAHALATALGAVEVRSPAAVMSATYSSTQGVLSPSTLTILRKMLGLYETFPRDRVRWTVEAKLALEALLADVRLRRTLVAEQADDLRHWLAGPPVVGTARPTKHQAFGDGLEELNLVQNQTYNAAVGKLDAGEPSKAWELIAPLFNQVPKSAHVGELACRAAGRRDDDATTVTVCRRAAAISDSATPTLIMADALRRQGEDDKARLLLVDGVVARLGTRETALYAAETLLSMNYLSDAEDAAARALPGRQAQVLTARIKDARRMYGMRRGLVDAADEAAALDLVRNAVKSSDPKPWADASEAFRARFGDGAPVHLLRCGADLNLGRIKEAQEACDRALELDSQCGFAHALLGHLNSGKGNRGAALEHLNRAIELSPGRRYPYLVLANMLRRYRDEVGLRALDARFRDRFGESLP